MPIKSFTLERYVEAMESSEGLCVSCGEVAGYDFVEPDARELECHDCGEFTVYGAEELVLMGLVLRPQMW
tara:strand:- start:12895 stop:13104 length:210 start_codon:yes stop_codon:yes gene_type:complete